MNTTTKNRLLNSLLWASQLLLSLSFIWAAYMKLLSSSVQLAQIWPWTAEHQTLVKLTGILDLLAGIGLALPILLPNRMQIAVFAAFGTCALMIAAISFHLIRGEATVIGFNCFVLALACFIIWGRKTRP